MVKYKVFLRAATVSILDHLVKYSLKMASIPSILDHLVKYTIHCGTRITAYLTTFNQAGLLRLILKGEKNYGNSI